MLTKFAKELKAPNSGIEVEFVPWWHPTALLAGTAGNLLSSLPLGALLQEHYAKSFFPPDRQQLLEAIKPFEHAGVDGVKIRVGASDPIGGALRILEERKNFSEAAAVFLSLLTKDLTKSDHYNPFTKTVTLYSNHPQILQHELGHALQPDQFVVDNLLRGNFIDVERDANNRALSALKSFYASDTQKYLQEAAKYRDVVYRGTSSYEQSPLINLSGMGAGAIAGYSPGLFKAVKLNKPTKLHFGGRFAIGGLVGTSLGSFIASEKGKEKAQQENIAEKTSLLSAPANIHNNKQNFNQDNKTPIFFGDVNKILLGAAGIGAGSLAALALLRAMRKRKKSKKLTNEKNFNNLQQLTQ